jgi:transcriptional regulator with XRE-family HTH domain
MATAVLRMRIESGLNQAEFGRYIGLELGRDTISKYEKGERPVPYSVLMAIADKFGMTIDAVLAQGRQPRRLDVVDGGQATLRPRVPKSIEERVGGLETLMLNIDRRLRAIESELRRQARANRSNSVDESSE